MEKHEIIELTKEQCLYALKQSLETCRVGIGHNGSVLIGTELVLGIYNFLSDGEKLYIKKEKED